MIYVNCYFRIVGEKEGVKETFYTSFGGLTISGFDSEDYEKAILEMKESYERNGFENIVIDKCSKEEYKEEVRQPEIAPVGYLKVYQRIDMKQDEDKLIVINSLECDFNEYFDNGLWDSLAEHMKTFYENQGYSEINVSSATEEQYIAYIKTKPDMLAKKVWNGNE